VRTRKELTRVKKGKRGPGRGQQEKTRRYSKTGKERKRRMEGGRGG